MYYRLPILCLGLTLLCGLSLITATQAQDHTPISAITVVLPNNIPPFVFTDDQGQYIGSRREIWQLWEAQTGISVAFTPMAWPDALSQFERGEADVIDVVTQTPERDLNYLFSPPFTRMNVRLFFHQDLANTAQIVDAASARGFAVGVGQDDACAGHLLSQGVRRLRYYPHPQAMIAAAVAGDIRLFCLHEQTAHYLLNEAGVADQFRNTAPLYGVDSHWAVLHTRPELFQIVEAGFARIAADEQRQMEHKWFGRRLDSGQTTESAHDIDAMDDIAYGRYIGYGLLALSLSVLAAWFWNYSLRRRVRRTTAGLEQTLMQRQATQAEIELARANLEQQVAQHTADLAAINQELSTILDTANSGMALIKNKLLVRCNRYMHELFAWPYGELEGQPIRVLYASETAWTHADTTATATLSQNRAHQWEQQLLRKDGSLFWGRISAHALDYQRPEHGVIWVVEDITQERMTLDELNAARKLAEHATQWQADFLAHISQEIRTPMNAIIGISDLLLNTELSHQQQTYLRKLQKSGRNLLDLINDLLDVAKIEAGKLDIEQHEFKILTVLSHTTAAIVEQAAQKDLELIVRVDEDVPHSLIGDPLRIEQVLLNYAQNAVTCTEEGEITFRVSVAETREEQLLLKFAVHDTGIGLSADQQSRLFEHFMQADSSAPQPYAGTGLGLLICKRLAELMGGQVGLSSQAGIGSTFWFTTRVKRSPQSAQDLIPDPELRGTRILVVDDNEQAREVLNDMLRNMSFLATAVSSGSEAIAAVAQALQDGNPYAVALIDGQMPTMDGITTSLRLREQFGDHTPQVIIIATHGREALVHQARSAGISTVLLKPIDPALLLDTLRRMLVSPAAPVVTSQ